MERASRVRVRCGKEEEAQALAAGECNQVAGFCFLGVTVAAVLSFFTARSVRLDNESSKLLLLTPHNDTVYDLQDALGLPASNYPPTLYDFYLTILYKQNFLATNAENLKLF